MRDVPLKDIARGHWEFLLQHFGLGDVLRYQRKEGPCPICGGTTRFRFTNRNGNGDYYCNNTECGPSDGFNLITRATGISFADMAKEVKSVLGYTEGAHVARSPLTPRTAEPAKPSKAEVEERCKRLQAIWDATKPITAGDVADRYLLRRGLALKEYPSVMRLHPGLDYWDQSGEKPVKLGTYPCLVTLVQDEKGRSVNLHRTYLSVDGTKAPVPNPKKTLSPVRPMAGAAAKLFAPTDKLVVAEGVETALAAHFLTKGLPVWATLSAPLMRSMRWPEGIRTLIIFGDRDADDPETGKKGAGQAAAQELARRFIAAGGEAKIYLPDTVEEDFADVWLRQPRLKVA